MCRTTLRRVIADDSMVLPPPSFSRSRYGSVWLTSDKHGASVSHIDLLAERMRETGKRLKSCLHCLRMPQHALDVKLEGVSGRFPACMLCPAMLKEFLNWLPSQERLHAQFLCASAPHARFLCGCAVCHRCMKLTTASAYADSCLHWLLGKRP